MQGGTRYVSIGDQMTYTRSNGQTTTVYSSWATYLVRDDGVVARTIGKGTIDREYEPPAGVMYVGASSGESSSYLLLSDGKIHRLTGKKGDISMTIDGSERKTDDGCKNRRYVAVSCGDTASYWLRDDGSVDRTAGKGVVTQRMVPQTKEEVDAANASKCLVS